MKNPLLIFLVLLFAPLSNSRADEQERVLAVLVETIAQCEDDAVRVNLLQGMVKGLAGRRGIPSPIGWNELNQEFRESSNQSLRNLARQLSQTFGDPQAMADAMKILQDPSADLNKRRAALQSLVTQRYKDLPGALPKLLGKGPLRINAIRAMGELGADDAAKQLLSLYPELQPQEQRAVIETLATRKNHAAAMVGALKDGTIQKSAIPSYIARSMRDMLGNDFTRVYGKVRDVAKNTKQLMAYYLSLIHI